MRICNSHGLQGCKLGHLKGFRFIDQGIMATMMRFCYSSKLPFTHDKNHRFPLCEAYQLYVFKLVSLTMGGYWRVQGNNR